MVRIVSLNDHFGFSVVNGLDRASMNTESPETIRIVGFRDDSLASDNGS